MSSWRRDQPVRGGLCSHLWRWGTGRPRLDRERRRCCLERTVWRIYPGHPERNRIPHAFPRLFLIYPSSYVRFSFFVASRALMILIVSSSSRCTITNVRPDSDCPIVMNLISPRGTAGSRIVTVKGSPKTVAASSKETPCLRTFEPVFRMSHSNVSPTIPPARCPAYALKCDRREDRCVSSPVTR